MHSKESTFDPFQSFVAQQAVSINSNSVEYHSLFLVLGIRSM